MSAEPDSFSLRLLVLVGELGSLGRAAGEMGISQPAASKRLTELEQRLRLVLVTRTKRGSELTPEGRMVADWARRVLDAWSGLLTGVDALRAERDAELRVAASMTVAEHLLPGWIGELRRGDTQLYVGMQVINSDGVAELVRSGAVQLGFVESPEPPHGLSSRAVAGDRLAVLVEPRHPWARRRQPVQVGELAATGLVVRERGSGTRETLERAVDQAGAGAIRPLLELGSTTAVRSAVVTGAGPAVLSTLAVAEDLGDGRLVEVDVPGLDLRRSLRAVWPQGRRLVGPAATLVAVARRAAR